jgi:hypothetical protein
MHALGMKYTNDKNNISEILKVYIINREYYMALSVSHPVSTRDTNIIVNAYSVMSGLILIFKMHDLVILFIIYLVLNKGNLHI